MLSRLRSRERSAGYEISQAVNLEAAWTERREDGCGRTRPLGVHTVILAQGADHWVGTWSTAEVGRPQSPLPPVPVLPPFMANQCPPPAPPTVAAPQPGQTFAPLQFTHFTNQTLRQIVHTSIGG